MPTTVITGANRGIGLELAAQCLKRGDTVIAGCRSPGDAHELMGLVPERILELDVGDEASIASFARSIEGPIDLLINNAGTSASNLGLSRDRAGVIDAPIALTLD